MRAYSTNVGKSPVLAELATRKGAVLADGHTLLSRKLGMGHLARGASSSLLREMHLEILRKQS